MKLFTELTIASPDRKINLSDAILLCGSCFTAHIGEALENHGFDCSINPFGTMYNPVSVLNSIRLIFGDLTFADATTVQADTDKNWYTSTEIKQQKIPEISNQSNRKYNFIFISYGTPWVWETKLSNSNDSIIVSNCHKQPASLFNRRRLSALEIKHAIDTTIRLIKEKSPDAEIIFTVSPIRYVKDGLIENTRSKSLLHLAIEDVCTKNEKCSYFPSYELFIDEMRDYRFYAEDLIHPGAQGIQYVCERFEESYLDRKSIELGKRIKKSLNFLNHKGTHSKASFEKALLKAKQLSKTLPDKAAYSFLKKWENADIAP